MPKKTKEQKEIKNIKNKEEKVETSKKTKGKSSKAISKAIPSNKKENKNTVTIKKSTTPKKATKATTKTAAKTSTKKTINKKETNTSSSKNTSSKKIVPKKDEVLTNNFKIVEYYDLPYRYNQTIVRILAQTPNNLFIYWDVSDDDIEKYKKEYGNDFLKITKPVLIVYNLSLNYSFEVDINDFANCWYLSVNNSKCEYKIELGRRPIQYKEKFNTDYIYITESNKIESPNDRILLDTPIKTVKFRNVKTNLEYTKSIYDLKIAKNIKEIYNIYDLYEKIYNDENIEELYDLSNPSSKNSSSECFVNKF